MSPCDCGLVTPTLDELLAVARQKPLPRVRVRERRPPPAKVGATLKGWLEWRLINRQGREVRGGEGPNLILDQGLDLIASVPVKRTIGETTFGEFPIIRYAAVGTDSTSPDPSQTGLGSELARTNTTFAADAVARPSPGVYQLTKSIEFDYGEANGNLTEWGFSNSASAGSNLFNRALFTDSNGDPDPVTKTDQEKLRLIYTLEIALSPVAFTAGSFDLTNVGTVTGAYTLLGWVDPSNTADILRCPDLQVFSALARADLGTAGDTGSQVVQRGSARAWNTDLSGVTYTEALSLGIESNLRLAAREVIARDAYAPGSFTRTGGAWKWDTGYGNVDPLLAVTIQGNHTGVDNGRPGYVFAIDAGFAKDNEHTLTIGVPTVTWGRAP